MVDRVIPIKHEATSRGGSVNDTRYTPANPNQDGLEAAGFYPQNASSRDLAVGITRNSSGDLVLHDSANYVLLGNLPGFAKRYYVEGFESTVFPPNSMWSTPGDLCPAGVNTVEWVRSTDYKVSGGAAAAIPQGTHGSASGNGWEAHNTVSHIQLDYYSPTWFRLSFDFGLICEDGADFFSFYIGNQLEAQWTGYLGDQSYSTGWMSPGHYRFVWAGTTNSSYIEDYAYCCLDNVKVETFEGLRDFPVSVFTDCETLPSGYGWTLTTTGTSAASISTAEKGICWIGAYSATLSTSLQRTRHNFGLTRGRNQRFQARLKPNYVGSNRLYIIGLTDYNDTAHIALVYDPTVSANWLAQAKTASGTTNINTGIPVSTTKWVDLVIETGLASTAIYVNGESFYLSSSPYLPPSTTIIYPSLQAGATTTNTYGVVTFDFIAYRQVVTHLGAT